MAKKRWKKKEREVNAKVRREEGGTDWTKIIGTVLFLAIVGYLLFGQGGNTQTPTSNEQALKGRFTLLSDKPSTHTPGKVVLTEFFDFYCPHCYRFYKDRWPALKEKYDDKIELVEYGFPLRDSSIPPIEAYGVAQDRGKGEEMKGAMFKAIHEEGRDISNVEALTEIAEQVGMDGQAFSSALKSHAALSRVNEKIRLGSSYNVDQTPTVVIDGNVKVTDTSVENLELIIDSILAGE